MDGGQRGPGDGRGGLEHGVRSFRGPVMGPASSLLMLARGRGRGRPGRRRPPPAGPLVRKPKISWTLQFGLAHSVDDENHYAVSGFQGRFPIFAFDRTHKSDRLGGLGIEVGAYPYPVTVAGLRAGCGRGPGHAGEVQLLGSGRPQLLLAADRAAPARGRSAAGLHRPGRAGAHLAQRLRRRPTGPRRAATPTSRSR